MSAEEAAEREAILQGIVDRVTYRSPESGYMVLRLTPERGHGDPEAMFATERITAVGQGPEVGDGQRLRLTGTWSRHPQHGRQFRFDSIRSLPPLDREGLERYLASSTFRGIGPKLAERIVAALGTNALARIREEPDALVGVPGLRADVRRDLIETVRTELGSQETLAFLYGVGLGPVQAELVARSLGPDAEAVLRANPYLLARGIAGIGFHTADSVARSLGIALDAPERRHAAMLHALGEAAGEGHCLQPLRALAERADSLVALGRPVEEWEVDARALDGEGALVLDQEVLDEPCAYLPAYHTAESRLASNLTGLMGVGPVRRLADDAALLAAESAAGLELHADQREAVLGLLSHPVSLLTGGPGVGKTTIVRLVVELAERASARVVLASPTGRAAKRLAEATGREASTLHRLLGWEPARGSFQHDAHRPLEADLVVVDEISMLDVVLAHHLVKAIQPPTRLVLVGDPDQLPSVSPGNVLADLLSAGCVPAYRLSHIYRQSAESLIVANAHRILAGEMPDLPGRSDPTSDFYFFPAEEDEEAADRLIEVVTERIPARFGLDWVRDVQVLSPMYKGACGVDALNERLRDAQGVGGRELFWRGRVWRLGDRVIHTRNDYEKNVFNGDMGRIEHVDADGGGLTVRFPEREVRYTTRELTDLSPAFCITVHRSQGGEFPCVVLPLVTRHFTMLQRHLLYTAVTRARDLVVLVGSQRALRRAVENAEVSERRSALAERVRRQSLSSTFATPSSIPPLHPREGGGK